MKMIERWFPCAEVSEASESRWGSGKSEKALFIDLNRIVMGKYAGMAVADIKGKYYTPADNTHTSAAGAELNASCVAEGIRALKDCPLSKYLVDAGK